MTIKLLHTADLHLDSPLRSLAMKDETLRAEVKTASRTALSRMVRYCIDEGVAALLIAGDLYDGRARSAKTAAFLGHQMDLLHKAGIKVFYVKGNHDAENPISGEIALPPNVHVFDGRGGKVRLEGADIWIHGVSFRDKHAPESLVPKFQPPEAEAVNIALMHSSLTGAEGHDNYAPCTLASLLDAGFDYWALGHIHKRALHSENPWIVMPGCPQGRDIGEAGAKSASLLTVDGGKISVSEVLTSVVEFRHVSLTVEASADDADLRRQLQKQVAHAAVETKSEAAILRVRLTGTTEHAWQFRRDSDYWRDSIAEMAAETGRLWIEQVDFDLAAPKADTALMADATDELRQMMEDIRRDAGFQAQARVEFDQMLSQLPPDRRKDALADQAVADALFEKLGQDAVLAMTARMLGVTR